MPHSDHPDSSLLIAAAVIKRDGRFLLGRRPPGKRHGGLWEFPGGKLLEGESVAQAIARELFEELGLEVDHIGPILFSATDPESSFEICFIETSAHGDPSPREHTELIWADLRSDLPSELAPADKRFVTEWLGGRESET